MHTNKTKERQGLVKLLGLAVAGATLLAGMVALPVTKASASPDPATGLDTDDQFTAGALDGSKVPSVTVTKYLSSSRGNVATGSAMDKPVAGTGTPAQGIVFNVKEITPSLGHSAADLNLNDPSSYTIVDAVNYYAGTTDGQGVISTWYTNQPDGKPSTTAKAFPTGVHYYMMTENRAASPAFIDGTIDAGRYQISAPSMFSLPYKTTTPTGNVSGYIYNLHLYPKNVDSSDLSKVVSGTTDAGGTSVGIPVPGNYIYYKITQKIYNAPAVANDDKLQVSEITGTAPHLRIVDRMSPSMSIDTSSIAVKLTWTGGSTNTLTLNDSADYSYSSPTAAPSRIQASHTADHFFPNLTTPAKYHQFDFFNNPSAITSLVGSGQDAEHSAVLNLEITYRATVTAVGAGLDNDVASDHIDYTGGTLPGGHTSVPSGTAVFGKLKKDGHGGYAPLEGAVFRLSDPSDPTVYLASDGNFYHDTTTLPGGVTFYEATSNVAGVVAFTALPILAGGVGVPGNWNVVEYRSPAGYKPVSVAFEKVEFGSDVVGKTAAQLVTAFGTNPILSDSTKLHFGAYEPTASPATPIQYHGRAVQKYIVNFNADDNGTDVPANLPLTGGRGIILLLVVGVAIMGGALYIRSRRNATQA